MVIGDQQRDFGVECLGFIEVGIGRRFGLLGIGDCL